MSGAAATPAHGDARPLLARGRLVTVDGHPICAACGAAVLPAPAGRWEHLGTGRRFPHRSRWFAPVTWAELNGLRTYQEFTERYPWTVRPELCGGAITSWADWREGVRRLRDYHRRLAAIRRRRVLRRGENPYLELAGVLAGVPPRASADAGGGDRDARGAGGDRGGGGNRDGGGDRGDRGAGGAGDLSWSLPGGLGSVLNLPARRRELAALFSWAIPAPGALAVLGQYAPLVECGAGTGYWAALLRTLGTDIVACDIAPPGAGTGNRYHAATRRPWTEIGRASAVTAIRANRGRTLFLCWPPYDDDGASYAALHAYRGDVVVYAGGGPGGATGTVRFHRELELNWHPAEQAALPTWPGLRDRLVVYRRNPVRRPLSRRDRCASCRRFIPTGSVGRCDACFARRPPAMALRVSGHRVEYPQEVVDAMPAGLRLAFERSPALIRPEAPRGR
jgi:hypothetical protein